MTEEWKALPRFNNLLEVSDLGGVRTVGRTISNTRGGSYKIAGRLLKTRRHPWGYRWCEFMLEGVKHWDFVHRLVAEGFKGPCPKGIYVLHFDNDPANNLIGNLRYGTPTENCEDKWMHGTQPHGDQIWWKKVDSSQVMAIRDARACGVKIKDLSAQYEISEAQVSRICTGKKWATCDGHVGSKSKKTKFLSNEEKIKVLEDRKSGMTITQLSEKFEVSRNQIHCYVRKHED